MAACRRHSQSGCSRGSSGRASGPLRQGAFRSTLHDERVATILGIALGVCFIICFATGLVSHLVQRGPDWWRESWPTDPVSLYRITQGVHVLTGFAAIPLLLVKLWAVYPRLWAWPPFSTITQAVERASVFLLIGGATFQLTTRRHERLLLVPLGLQLPERPLRRRVDRDRRARHAHRRQVGDRARGPAPARGS